MRRAAIFAHYDKDDIIDDYVIYYLKSLRKICEKVIFVSCCNISSLELRKLENIVDFSIVEKHSEYDFGSYKRGFFYLKNNDLLKNIDSIIFANDSCYAPLYPLEKVFADMEQKNCDFWGITKNKFGMRKENDSFIVCKRQHIQSYFLVFNSAIFNSNEFYNFLAAVKQENKKNDVVINYEIGLYEHLTSLGYESEVYVQDYFNVSNSTILKWRQLAAKSPFIKCNLLRNMYKNITVIDDWERVLNKLSSYPTALIKKNLERTMPPVTKTILPLWIKRIIFDTTAVMPNCLRTRCSIAIGWLLKRNLF